MTGMCDERDTELSSSVGVINSCRAVLASLFCENSGEANISMLRLPSTSDDTGVDVTSSTERYVDPKLALLDGYHRARERAEEVRRAEVEVAGHQATMTAHETRPVRMKMTFFLRDTKMRAEPRSGP